MPRLKQIKYNCFFCHQCKVVVPIAFEAAAEVSRHIGHPCEYAWMRAYARMRA